MSGRAQPRVRYYPETFSDPPPRRGPFGSPAFSFAFQPTLAMVDGSTPRARNSWSQPRWRAEQRGRTARTTGRSLTGTAVDCASCTKRAVGLSVWLQAPWRVRGASRRPRRCWPSMLPVPVSGNLRQPSHLPALRWISPWTGIKPIKSVWRACVRNISTRRWFWIPRYQALFEIIKRFNRHKRLSLFPFQAYKYSICCGEVRVVGLWRNFVQRSKVWSKVSWRTSSEKYIILGRERKRIDVFINTFSKIVIFWYRSDRASRSYRDRESWETRRDFLAKRSAYAPISSPWRGDCAIQSKSRSQRLSSIAPLEISERRVRDSHA